jgi:hypothetical protein
MAGLVHHRKIGYINVKGEMVIPQTLDGGSEFVNGLMAEGNNSEYQVINTAGRTTCTLGMK